MHDVEFARRALEIAGADRVRHRFEIAHRLQGDDLQPEIRGHLPGVARLAAEEGQIVLENLNRAKSGFGRRSQLAFERAAHAHRRNRPFEHL